MRHFLIVLTSDDVDLRLFGVKVDTHRLLLS